MTRHLLPLFLLTVGCATSAREPSLLSRLDHQTLIILQQTPCFGTCPSYVLTIRGNGRVTLEPGVGPGAGRMVEGHMDWADLRSIVAEFERTKFLEVREPNGGPCLQEVTDSSTRFITFRIGSREHRVKHYLGCANNTTLHLLELESVIADRTHLETWLRELGAD